MSILKHRKQKELLLEIDKGMITISEVLKNLIKMQAVTSNGKIRLTN